MKTEEKIKAKKHLVERELKRILGKYEGELVRSMKYAVFSGGKRFRPILVLATGECFGCESEKTLPFACAVEFIHNYSLIHDDLPAMDNDDFRRGKPSCHKAFGEDVAILAGDALLTLAFEVLSGSSVGRGRIETKCEVIKEISRSAGISGMIGGQYLDIKLSTEDFKWEDYHTLALKKTGRLISASVRTGALLGQASSDEIKAVSEYAENLGFAFQIRDDILDSHEDIQDGKMISPNEVFFHGREGAKKELFKYVNSAVKSLDRNSIKSDELRYLALKLLEVNKNNGK
ncbi:MAG: polyprenyl synthetase family protein [Candidatus Aminicenantes bacterium]